MTKAGRGSNIVGVGAYNERLVLALIRDLGPLPKTELTRLTGLSKQTLSDLVGRLEAEDLLLRGEPQRGRVGQPLVPFALNPAGAYGLGFKVGRKSFDFVLVDFAGRVVESEQLVYDHPTPDRLEAFFTASWRTVKHRLRKPVRERIIGLGVAMPSELWRWTDEIGAPEAEMAAWRDYDVAGFLRQASGLPVHLLNDVTAACTGELIFGQPRQRGDFVYVYMGAFIGGGLVLNGTVFVGSRQNAGAVGSMVTFGRPADGNPRQLLSVASIMTLHRSLLNAGRDPSVLWTHGSEWLGIDDLLEAWVEEVGWHLAVSAVNAVALTDVPILVIDGAIPERVRDAIVGSTQRALARLPDAGLRPLKVMPGSLGRAARAVGAASLPIQARLAYDPGSLLKGLADDPAVTTAG